MNWGVPGQLPFVELHFAWCWTCETCGRDNFDRAPQIEPAMIEHLVAEEDREVFDGVEGGWCWKPKQVNCRHCGQNHVVDEG